MHQQQRIILNEMDEILKILLLGVFATVVMDIWATFSNKILKFPRTNWAMVGRWLGHIPSGQLVHTSINSAPEIKNENAIGWAFHYLIGTAYAAFYVFLVFFALGGQPSLLSAWIFGLATILSPWFIMQPSLGMGFFASKAPQPNMVRLQNFAIHSIFGAALYYGWLWGINA